MDKIAVFWHRRDLRLQDNAGLYQALESGHPVLPVFIFDTHILESLEDQRDPRVTFIYDTVAEMDRSLREQGRGILVLHGEPLEVFKTITSSYEVAAVFTNRDYEPYATGRDERIESFLGEKSIPFHTFKDHVIFEREEILKNDGTPYTVFTPYSRKWKARLEELKKEESEAYPLAAYPSEVHIDRFYRGDIPPLPTLPRLGFERSDIPVPSKTVSRGLIKNYENRRNFPAIRGTSRLGVHFRFGTISIRKKASKAQQLSPTYLNELIWRDFYAQILWHFPRVVEQSFRPEYDFIEWRNDESEFKRWCEGRTGYPIVDAGMRELNATGFMHNRVRMITASFLTKHLLIDWRWGEAYFASKLLDYELASNNGGWQWAAGTGTDAAPYFRIFNPYSQQKKFDKGFDYVRQWVPEFESPEYPRPIVDHKIARERCLQTYKEGIARGRKTVR